MAEVSHGGAVELESGDLESNDGQASCGGAGDHRFFYLFLIN